jgi:hypothetical protein
MALAVAFAMLWTTAAFAGLGKIAGTIKDAQTGQPLPGVNVTIVGTTMGASTDLEGRYFILNVPPGTYQLRASIIGYEPVVISNVVSRLDVTTTVDFELRATVVEVGEEVTIVAERPLVDRTLTASRTSVDAKEIQSLPVVGLNDIVNSTASAFKNYIRGGRKFETKTILDGVDVSDTYFSGGTGRGALGLYNAVQRSDERETAAVEVATNAVQELDVYAGTFNAEYPAANAGIVNIVTRDGGAKVAGSLIVRSSTGGLDHVRKFKLEDGTDKDLGEGHEGGEYFDYRTQYIPERDALRARTDAASIQKAARYNFDPNKISYGDDPTVDAQFTLSGPLPIVKDMRFFLTGSLFNSHGRYPNEFQREIDGSLKLSYNLSPTIKMTGALTVEDGGILGGWKNRPYNNRFKYFLQGIPQNAKLGLVGNLKWTHTLSPKTFYEIQISQVNRRSEFGFSDDDGDGYPELGEDGDFIKFNTLEQYDYYFGDGAGNRTLTRRDASGNIVRNAQGARQFDIVKDASGNSVPAFFNGTPLNFSASDVGWAASTFKIGTPGMYYDNLKRNVTTVKADYTSQVTFHHQIKAGIQYRYHTLDQELRMSQIGGVDAKKRFEESVFKLNPKEYAAYVQDRIEYKGIIVNAGLRLDGFDKSAQDFNNIFKPYDAKLKVFDPIVQDTVLTRIPIRSGELATDWLFSPRIGVSHPITENAAMHYSWGRFFQIPQFSFIFDRYGDYANPSLPNVVRVDQDPYKATAYEMGVQYSFLNNYRFDVTAYYRDIENYGEIGLNVIPRAGVGVNYFISTNFGYADSRGIEVSLERRPARFLSDKITLSGRLNYAYTYIKAAALASFTGPKTAFTTTGGDSARFGGQLPWDDFRNYNTIELNVRGGQSSFTGGYDRPHRVTLSLVAGLPFDVTLSSLSTFQSGFYYPLTLEDPDGRLRKIGKAPWNSRTDLRLDKGLRFGQRRAAAFLEIRNLFNRVNIIGYDNSDVAGQELFEQTGNPTGQYGRTTFVDGSNAFDIVREIYAGIDFKF